ncbi:ATP synthase mitochondrial F1 complex assembly factor 1 [Tachyglossus aculeatus]|uniref:ATP synthase mitochondrial F1 complex assembly factor 1 n=1 Tax=Tachyglossus aculeatus TaxID=9261 RepID=UPI0018F5D58C|nr:ATP synthase mitochondrial F1 complex assembly factor 1 [Tachyglossus aculeatus]
MAASMGASKMAASMGAAKMAASMLGAAKMAAGRPLRGLKMAARRSRALSGLCRLFSAGPAQPPLHDNPFFGKYRQKIQRLQRSDPEAFKCRLEQRSALRKQPLGRSKQAEFVQYVEEKAGDVDEQPRSKGFTRNKALSSILNLDLVKDKTAEEIGQIWQQYFSAKDTVFAVIPAKTFDLLWTRAQACPSFLYALPRREGYEFFVGQWSGTELHFTALINIQTRGDAAASQLVLYHYPELKAEKGIVLVTAELEPTFLTVPEARCLASQVQFFYATDCQQTFALVETFNHRPGEFEHTEVIAALQRSGLGADPKLPPPGPARPSN